MRELTPQNVSDIEPKRFTTVSGSGDGKMGVNQRTYDAEYENNTGTLKYTEKLAAKEDTEPLPEIELGGMMSDE